MARGAALSFGEQPLGPQPVLQRRLEAIIDVSALPGSAEVPSLALKLRCSGCGSRPAFVRPNWLEMRVPGTGAGRSKIVDEN
jgi:hypothetical protein